MYARVQEEEVVEILDRPSRPVWYSGRWWDVRDDGEFAKYLESAGWVSIQEVPKPADTDAGVWVRNYLVVSGIPTVSWTQVPFTEAQVSAKQEAASRETARTAVKAIINDLQAEKARADAVIAKANNTISGADTKDVARAAKRIADAAIDLARFVKDI